MTYVFFETIKYLGGQRTRNFVRGPGFHGTGRGGRKQFTSFSDFVTSAEATFMTSADNSATMPVEVHYHPKSVTGEEMLSQIFEMAKTVQVCERCLTKSLRTIILLLMKLLSVTVRVQHVLTLNRFVNIEPCYEPALRCCPEAFKETINIRKRS